MSASLVLGAPARNGYEVLELLNGCGWAIAITAVDDGLLRITARNGQRDHMVECTDVQEGVRRLVLVILAQVFCN